MGRSRTAEHRAVLEYVPAPTRRDLMRPLVDAGLSSAEAYSVLRMVLAALETDR